MKRLLLVAILLFPGLSAGQEIKPDPEAILARAVAQVIRSCTFETVREDLNGAHEPVKVVPPDDDEKKDKTSYTIDFLLRTGRYIPHLESVKKIVLTHKKKDLLPPLGDEDWRVVWAMNRLDGHVFLDPDTGELTKVDMWLPEVVGKLKVVELLEVNFSLFQEKREKGYVPQKSVTEMRYRLRGNTNWKNLFLGWREVHKRFTTVFTCS